MIRITSATNFGMPVSQTSDIHPMMGSIPVDGPAASAETTEQTARIHIVHEIQALEAKIEEVNQILCKTNLEYIVRFQLKDDLEYYHTLIENKRNQLDA